MYKNKLIKELSKLSHKDTRTFIEVLSLTKEINNLNSGLFVSLLHAMTFKEFRLERKINNFLKEHNAYL